jgi:hypothetical protein
MKYSYTLLLFTIALLGRAQDISEWLDINDARVRFYSNGQIGRSYDASLHGYFVPFGSNTSPLYTAGLWIGGIDNNGQLHVAAQLYGANGQDLYPGPLTVDGTASITATVSQAYDQIWKVNRNDVILHRQFFECVQDPNCDPTIQFPGYTIPDAFSTWPAHGDVSENQAFFLAPFYDRNIDGIYDPNDGDHPCVPGDQALYMIFNDNTQPHTESLGMPIGLEVHMMPFAYSGNDPSLEQTIFVHYKLINRSSQTLNDVFVGTFADGDIGCSNDDFIGSDVRRNMMFFYNWDDIDLSCGASGLGYGSTPPAFGIVTLKGPKVDINNMDDGSDLSLPSYNGSGFNDGVIDNERHGLSRMMYFNREGNQAITDPSSAVHFYNYLSGKWKNGVQMSYGGVGYPADTSSYVPAFFMYPWDTDTLGVGTNGMPMPDWRETQPTPTQPDRRGIASMGPFTLEAGEEDDILIAYVFARAETGGAVASVDALKARVDSVRAFAGTIPGIMAPGSACEDFLTRVPDGIQQNGTLNIYPNPSSGTVSMDLPASATIRIFDNLGAIVLEQKLDQGTTTLSLEGIAPGLYHAISVMDGKTVKGRFIKH